MAGALFLLLTAGAGAAWAAGEWDSAGQERAGVWLAWKGTALQAPGILDKNAVAASVDSKSGEPSVQAPVRGEHDVQTIEVQLQTDGRSETLTFRYQEDGRGGLIVLPDPEAGYVPEPVPGTRQTLIAYKASIYLLDADKKTLSPFLKDVSGGYDRSRRPKAAGDSNPPMIVWGERPSVNPEGTKMVFWTNRNIVKDGNPGGENWVKDLRTGAEARLFGEGHAVLGWDGQGRIVISRGNGGVYAVDAGSGSAERLLSSAATSALAAPYLLFQPEDGKLAVRDLRSGAQRVWSGAGLGRVRTLSPGPGIWAAVINAPDRTSSVSSLIVINAETLEYRRLDEPGGYAIVSVTWTDEETMLVHLQKRGSWEEKTYEIPLAALADDKGGAQ